MYEDNNNSIDWFKLILRVAIIILIFLLVLKLIAVIMTNRREKNKENIMNSNLKSIQNKLKDSLTDDLIPKDIGETNKYSLEELIDKKILNSVNDETGKECSRKDSYIEITKLEFEVQIKVNLVCNDKEDFSNTFIESKEEKTIEKKTTTKKTTTKKTSTKETKKNEDIIPITTKKKTITKKTTGKTTMKATTITTTKNNTYIVSFNTNGGNYIESQYIVKNGKAKYVKPVREGYTFVGWYHNGVKFNFDKTISSDIVLVAKWTKN